ncbi:MAG: hypothetical protein ACK5NC_11470 [Vibrio sp.]
MKITLVSFSWCYFILIFILDVVSLIAEQFDELTIGQLTPSEWVDVLFILASCLCLIGSACLYLIELKNIQNHPSGSWGYNDRT